MKMPVAMHHPLAPALDQPAAQRAGDQAHQGEGRDDRADLEVAHPEAAGEHRQHRHQHPEADGDAEGDQAEDVAPRGAVRSGRGSGRARARPVTAPLSDRRRELGVAAAGRYREHASVATRNARRHRWRLTEPGAPGPRRGVRGDATPTARRRRRSRRPIAPPTRSVRRDRRPAEHPAACRRRRRRRPPRSPSPHPTPEFDRAVPPGLQVAAAWSWRVLLVVGRALRPRLAGPLPVRGLRSRSPSPSCSPRCCPRWPTGCAPGGCRAARRRRSPCSAAWP